MRELTRILHNLNQGSISPDEAEIQIRNIKAPTMKDKNLMPLDIRITYNEAIELYYTITNYEWGFIDRMELIEKFIDIKSKYREMRK